MISHTPYNDYFFYNAMTISFTYAYNTKVEFVKIIGKK